MNCFTNILKITSSINQDGTGNAARVFSSISATASDDSSEPRPKLEGLDELSFRLCIHCPQHHDRREQALGSNPDETWGRQIRKSDQIRSAAERAFAGSSSETV
jgi:hypothetical protein